MLMPETDQRLLHVLEEGCQVISELLLDFPVRPLAVTDDLVVAVRSLDYPEIVTYRIEVSRLGAAPPAHMLAREGKAPSSYR